MATVISGKRVVVFNLPFKEITPLQQTVSELEIEGASVITIEYEGF
jgi:hypothetical protein